MIKNPRENWLKYFLERIRKTYFLIIIKVTLSKTKEIKKTILEFN